MAKQVNIKRKIVNRNEVDTMLTMREACHILHVHSNTLRRWCDNGILQTYRIGPGNHRRFKAKDLTALIGE